MKKLSGENLTANLGPKESDVKQYLEKLHPKTHSFLSLEDESGSYVQCAGAKLKLTIEYRKTNSKGFRHFVLRKESACSDDEILVNCNCGPITVRRNEVLTVEDVEVVFLHFLSKGTIPKKFHQREVTEMFS